MVQRSFWSAPEPVQEERATRSWAEGTSPPLSGSSKPLHQLNCSPGQNHKHRFWGCLFLNCNTPLHVPLMSPKPSTERALLPRMPSCIDAVRIQSAFQSGDYFNKRAIKIKKKKVFYRPTSLDPKIKSSDEIPTSHINFSLGCFFQPGINLLSKISQ